MKLKLVCRDTLATVREIVVDQFPLEMGRGEAADIRIDDRWLSRRHCRIDCGDEGLVVRDLGSRHGTYVNGQAISECKLLPGDELCIGLSHFVAEYAEDDAYVPAARSRQRVGMVPVLA
ncbi:MAG: FHA domain-containing protein [Pirellulaceae bacterium]|nr:FHA domain-containing protein [Pirellulaceae bacterium]